MLSAYADMWDGKLGDIQDAKNHVSLRETVPNQPVPNRSLGPSGNP